MRISIEDVETAIAAHKADNIKDYQHKGDPYRTEIWTFTRNIKSSCSPDSNPDKIFDEVDSLIEKCGGWEQVAGKLDDEEIYLEFISNWREIKYRTDESILYRVYLEAKLAPLSHECYAQNARLGGYAEFISLAGWLQKAVGNCPIMLPVERVGELLDKDPKSITRYRQKAFADGFLFLVSRHLPGRLATKFRFDVDQFPELMN